MPSKRKNSGSKNYEVGYGKPPKEHRFPKGRSGNPKGRPKGSQNMQTIMSKVLGQKITVNEGGKTRQVTKREGVATAQVNKAIRGDTKAAEYVYRVDPLNSTQPTLRRSVEEMAAEDRAILEAFTRRLARRTNEP